MSEIKVGDRVKVEYEGVVTWVSENDGRYLDVKSDSGFDNSYAASDVTKVAPPEPPPGSIAVVLSDDGREIVAYKRLATGWFTRDSSQVSWENVAKNGIVAIHKPEAS